MKENSSSCGSGFNKEAFSDAENHGQFSGGKTDTGESEHSDECRK